MAKNIIPFLEQDVGMKSGLLCVPAGGKTVASQGESNCPTAGRKHCEIH